MRPHAHICGLAGLIALTTAVATVAAPAVADAQAGREVALLEPSAPELAGFADVLRSQLAPETAVRVLVAAPPGEDGEPRSAWGARLARDEDVSAVLWVDRGPDAGEADITVVTQGGRSGSVSIAEPNPFDRQRSLAIAASSLLTDLIGPAAGEPPDASGPDAGPARSVRSSPADGGIPGAEDARVEPADSEPPPDPSRTATDEPAGSAESDATTVDQEVARPSTESENAASRSAETTTEAPARVASGEPPPDGEAIASAEEESADRHFHAGGAVVLHTTDRAVLGWRTEVGLRWSRHAAVRVGFTLLRQENRAAQDGDPKGPTRARLPVQIALLAGQAWDIFRLDATAGASVVTSWLTASGAGGSDARGVAVVASVGLVPALRLAPSLFLSVPIELHVRAVALGSSGSADRMAVSPRLEAVFGLALGFARP